MTWKKSFREAYQEKFACPDNFERHLLRRALHRRSWPIAWVIRILLPGFFELELRTVRCLGNSRSSEEFRSELDSYRSDYRRHGGVLRNSFAVRLSGRRLMNILMRVAPEPDK